MTRILIALLVALSTEHRALSTEHRALSTEHRALSTGHRALSTEHRALSTAPVPVEQPFKVPAAGEAVAVIHASCDRCDWGIEGRESAAVKIFVDGKYSQHLQL